MKFIHTADVHLGMQPDKGYAWSEVRGEELWETFRGIIGVCRNEKPDLLLIAGDLFHSQPRVRDLKEADALFASIPETKVLIIAGNHDYISGASNYNGFEWSPNVTLFKSEQAERIYFEDINTEIYGLSFCHRNISQPLIDGLKAEDPSHINILLLHGGDPTNLPFDKAKLQTTGFDYIACGHIHIPLELGDNIRYSGAPEPLDRNDTGHHGYICGEIMPADLRENRKLYTEFVPCCCREYFKCTVNVTPELTQSGLKDIIRNEIALKGTDNIYSFVLEGRRDPDTEFDSETPTAVGNIRDITDRTVPDYDFERLEAENSGNIIGKYISKIRAANVEDDIADKALEYGIGALLGRR